MTWIKAFKNERTYFAFIRPKCEYASNIWANCTHQDCNKLENVQLEIKKHYRNRHNSKHVNFGETNFISSKVKT